MYVSPFVRNIETAIHLFGNHPNKANINFVILPLIREYIVAKDDINGDIYQIMAKYTKENCGIDFDFSQIMKLESP